MLPPELIPLTVLIFRQLPLLPITRLTVLLSVPITPISFPPHPLPLQGQVPLQEQPELPPPLLMLPQLSPSLHLIPIKVFFTLTVQDNSSKPHREQPIQFCMVTALPLLPSQPSL